MKRRQFQAYRLGFKDGFDSPSDLGSGITWGPEEDGYEALNEAYDTGVNHGQIVGGILKLQWPQPWQDDFKA